MKITYRTNITNLPYSLHDMIVNDFCIEKNTLTMLFQDGFYRIGESCEPVDGYITFDEVDWDFCNAYVLNFSGNEGVFTGEKISLKNFVSKYKKQHFTIIDESYGYNTSKFSGYLSDGKELKECFIEIYCLGDMKYITKR